MQRFRRQRETCVGRTKKKKRERETTTKKGLIDKKTVSKTKRSEAVREGQGLDWIRNMDSKSKGRPQ